MKVRVTNGFCLGPGRDVAPGDVIELEEKQARRKIAWGWVVPIAEEPGDPAVASEPEPARTGEPDGGSETESEEGESEGSEPEGTARGRGRARRS